MGSPLLAADALKMPDESKTLGRGLPDIQLTDDSHKPVRLQDLLGKPVIVSPVFATCPHTCTPITRSLLKATNALRAKGYDFRVLTFSFDPNETQENLSALRKKNGLPADWIVARGSAKQTQHLLNAIDFQPVSTPDGGFDHPNLVVVTNAQSEIVKYVYGVELFPDEIELALIEAAKPTPWAHRYRSWLIIAALAAGVLLLVSIRSLWYSRRSLRHNPS